MLYYTNCSMLHNLNLCSHSGPLIMQHTHNCILLGSRKHDAQHIQFWKSGVHSTNWWLTVQQCTLILGVKDLVTLNFTDIKLTVKLVLHCWNVHGNNDTFWGVSVANGNGLAKADMVTQKCPILTDCWNILVLVARQMLLMQRNIQQSTYGTWRHCKLHSKNSITENINSFWLICNLCFKTWFVGNLRIVLNI